MAKKERITLNLSAKQAKRATNAEKRFYIAANKFIADLKGIATDASPGDIRNIVCNSMMRAAAQLAIRSARIDYKREPRRNYWLSAAGEAFDAEVNQPMCLTFVATKQESGKWTVDRE